MGFSAVHERTLIFDADGVLVEPWGFARELESRFGLPRQRWRKFFRGPFQETLTGRADLRDVLPGFLEDWGWSCPVEDFVATWMRSDDRPRHEVLDVVERLRSAGHVCCLATNQEANRARYMTEEMGFAQAFDALYFSCDLRSMKPEPEFYRTIQRDLGVEPSSIHFWDDSPSHVHAARRCGWHAYVFENVGSITRVVDEAGAEGGRWRVARRRIKS